MKHGKQAQAAQRRIQGPGRHGRLVGRQDPGGTCLRIRHTSHHDQHLEAGTGQEALARYGTPEIFNTDQGSQFTSDIEPTILPATGNRQPATGNSHPLDVNFIDEEDQKEPWKRPSPATKKLAGPMPKSLTVTLANWKEPRVIGCAESYPNHIALPRGCMDAALDLLRENAVGVELVDERCSGEPLEVAFAGTLRLDQETAVATMLHHDDGVLCAPTAFGKKSQIRAWPHRNTDPP